MNLFIPIFCASLSVVGFIALYILFRMDRLAHEKWQRLAPSLNCPQCGAPYTSDAWIGNSSWKKESHPSHSNHDRGVVLTCFRCRGSGYVVEGAASLQVFASQDEIV